MYHHVKKLMYTVRVDAGIATFRGERQRPDTIRVDLRLP